PELTLRPRSSATASEHAIDTPGGSCRGGTTRAPDTDTRAISRPTVRGDSGAHLQVFSAAWHQYGTLQPSPTRTSGARRRPASRSMYQRGTSRPVEGHGRRRYVAWLSRNPAGRPGADLWHLTHGPAGCRFAGSGLIEGGSEN